MRTIISMSGSRCQQYFLLSRCLDGILVWREATSCLWGEERRVRRRRRSLKFRINAPVAKTDAAAPSHIFKWGGANEEEKKSFPQHADVLIVQDNRWKSGLDSRLPHKLSSPQLPLHFIHFPPWPLLHAPPFTVNLQQVWASFFERSSTAGRRGPPAPSPPLSSATALIFLPREVFLRLHYPCLKCVRFRAFRSLKVVLKREGSMWSLVLNMWWLGNMWRRNLFKTRLMVVFFVGPDRTPVF